MDIHDIDIAYCKIYSYPFQFQVQLLHFLLSFISLNLQSVSLFILWLNFCFKILYLPKENREFQNQDPFVNLLKALSSSEPVSQVH